MHTPRVISEQTRTENGSARVYLLVLCVLAGFVILVMGVLSPSECNAQQVSSQVLIDRADKQAISGSTEIAFAWGQMFSPPQNLIRGVINLKEAMNRWTKIETTLDQHLLLGDPGIVNMPFVFVSTNQSFDITETEKKNLHAFFENGGFMFADNAQPQNDVSPGGASMKKMLDDALPEAQFAPVPNDNQIYHSFFDFNDGPPQGSDVNSTGLSREHYYLEGVWLDGDLVAVYSDKGYIVKWNDASNNEPQLRFGVNLIVYALTRGNTSAQRTFAGSYEGR